MLSSSLAKTNSYGAAFIALGLALTFGAPVHSALAANAEAGESNTALDEVLVTASRLTTGGFNAPTPTQVMSVEDIQTLAEPNIASAVGQLPALTGNLGSNVGNGGASSGNNGLTALTMRSLGTSRTLILIDGQRIASAFTDGTVDIALLPQQLIQRVDVVAGGVSASYGSDAVAGVVNFVTDTRFSGFKVNAQGGMTNYSDGRNLLTQAAWGGQALDDRFHMQVSGEYYDNDGIPSRPPGDNGGPNGRNWYVTPIVVTRTPAQTPAGQPQNNLYFNTQNTTVGGYGLILSGPLAGTTFGQNGTPYAFQYGSSCIGSFCMGGNQLGNIQLTSALDAELRRSAFYARAAYDLTPRLELYSTVSFGKVFTTAQSVAGTNVSQTNLTIQCSNPFVPAATQAACATAGITQFSFGVANINFPDYVRVSIERKQPRYVLGLNGKDLNMFGTPWTLQAYAGFGETKVHEYLDNIVLIPRYQAAIQATTLNGQIVCSSAAARAAGCVPYNPIGQVAVNPAAWAYISPADGPDLNSRFRQKIVSAALSGAPLQGWAGPVAVAVGAEWREESYQYIADWYGAGVDADSPVNGTYPADPLLSAATGNNWYVGNFHNGRGLYSVREAFAEIGLPLFNNQSFGKFDFNLAGRDTHYSNSGRVFTWKVGGVWDTPISGVRLRAVRSRDIRAPNLQDLYAPGLVQNMSGLTNRLTNQSVSALVTTSGNPKLTPEIAQSLNVGLVLQPDWLPGFHASFDYYSIKLKDGIQTLTGQQEVDLCQISGNANFCSLISFNPVQNTVKIQPFNAATLTLNGYDVAASYQFKLGSIPGSFSINAQASHANKFVVNSGIPGQPLVYYAGVNQLGDRAGFGNEPEWKGLVMEAWNGENLSLSLIQRFVGDGKINGSYIQCNPGSCPLPTVQNPTINNNHIAGAVYLDLAASYKIGPQWQLFLKVNNALDRDPPPLGSMSLYDYNGRIYRLGFRFNSK